MNFLPMYTTSCCIGNYRETIVKNFENECFESIFKVYAIERYDVSKFEATMEQQNVWL